MYSYLLINAILEKILSMENNSNSTVFPLLGYGKNVQYPALSTNL